MSVPRWICAVCYRSATIEAPGSHCGVPRVSLDDPAVVESMRERAEQILLRNKRREDLAIWAAAAITGGAICLMLRQGLREMDDLMTVLAGLVPALAIIYAVLHARLFEGSARATLAARRSEASADPSFALVREHLAKRAAADPRTMPTESLIAWLHHNKLD